MDGALNPLPAALRYEVQLASDSVCKDQLTLGELPADAWDLDADLDVSEPVPLDLAGLPRSALGAADLGAFEEQGVVPLSHELWRSLSGGS